MDAHRKHFSDTIRTCLKKLSVIKMASLEVKNYSNLKYLHSTLKYKLQAGGVQLYLY